MGQCYLELTLDEYSELSLDEYVVLPLVCVLPPPQPRERSRIPHEDTPGIGYNPIGFVELYDGSIVQTLSKQPDPVTFRNDYYYNARLNELFKKVSAVCHVTGRIDYYWKKISVY